MAELENGINTCPVLNNHCDGTGSDNEYVTICCNKWDNNLFENCEKLKNIKLINYKS